MPFPEPDPLTTRLRLRPEHLEAIIEHARREAPRECCGVGFGVDDRVDWVAPLTNLAPDTRHYLADAAESIRLLPRAREQSQDVVVIYHSHPGSAPTPSATDLRDAHWPGTPYLIVSLADPERPTYRAWHLIDGRSIEVECVVELEGQSRP